MKNLLLKISLSLVFLFCVANSYADNNYAYNNYSNNNYTENNSWYVAANGLNADYEGGSEESGYNVAVGKYLNDNVSIELGYADFGGDADNVNGVDAEFEATAIQFSAVGYLPVSENAGLFARIGVERLRTDATVNTLRANLDDTNPYYGVGGYMNISHNVDVRIEVQRHEILDSDLDTVSAGITVKTY